MCSWKLTAVGKVMVWLTPPFCFQPLPWPPLTGYRRYLGPPRSERPRGGQRQEKPALRGPHATGDDSFPAWWVMEAYFSSEGHSSWVLWRTHSLDWSFYNTGKDISPELAANFSSLCLWESRSLLRQGPPNRLLGEDVNDLRPPPVSQG